MSPQLDLELDRKKRRARNADDRLWKRALYWAPVWLPLVLLVQVSVFGLAPAWVERQRLDVSEAEVAAREADLQHDYEQLVRNRRKLSDPIYRERVRRSMLDLSRAPIILESTRDEGS